MSEAIITKKGQGRRYDYAPSEQMTFVVSAFQTAGQVDLAEGEFNYLGGPPLHIHPWQDEIHYILHGQLRYQIGEETVELESGDCIYIPKGIPHAWINLHQQPAHILAYLTPGGSEDFFKTLASSSSDSPDQEALLKLGEEYGAAIVGPPLAASLS